MKRTALLLVGCLTLALGSSAADEIDALISTVRNKEAKWAARSNAAWKLARSGDRRVISLFCELIDDPTEHSLMIGAACLAIGKFKVTEKVPRLIELLKEPAQLGGRPDFALAQIKDDRVVPALTKFGMFRDRALHYYVTRTDPRNQDAVPHLKKAVQSGELEVSLATLEYLIGEEEAAKFIPQQKDLVVTVDKAKYKREIPAWKISMKISIENISETPFLIRFHGSPSLCMVERRFGDFHEDPWCIEVKKSSKALTRIKYPGKGYEGPTWKPLRIESRETIHLDCRFVYYSGGFCLGPDGEEARPDNPQCRAKIVYASPPRGRLKRAYSQKFVLITRERKPASGDMPALAKALRDKDADVRRGAVSWLDQMGGAAVPLLARALEDEDKEIRRAAVYALGRVGPGAKDAVPALAKALKDTEPGVRSWAAEALGRIGSAAKDGLPALQAALEDDNRSVRWNAAWALGQMGSAAAETVPALQKALRDEDADVRDVVSKALKQIHAPKEKTEK